MMNHKLHKEMVSFQCVFASSFSEWIFQKMLIISLQCVFVCVFSNRNSWQMMIHRLHKKMVSHQYVLTCDFANVK